MIEINLHGSDASWTPDVLS